MKKWTALSITAVLLSAGIALANEKGSMSGEKMMQTIKGEVIDVSCYMSHGARGEGHRDCAVSCMRAGQPAGILEDGTGKVFIAAKETEHLINPNAELIPYAAKRVEVRGIVHQRGGTATIDIKEIKRAGGLSGMTNEEKGSGAMHKKGSGF